MFCFGNSDLFMTWRRCCCYWIWYGWSVQWLVLIVTTNFIVMMMMIVAISLQDITSNYPFTFVMIMIIMVMMIYLYIYIYAVAVAVADIWRIPTFFHPQLLQKSMMTSLDHLDLRKRFDAGMGDHCHHGFGALFCIRLVHATLGHCKGGQ